MPARATAARPTVDDALATVAAREPWLQVRAGRPDGQGWTRADRLLTRPALDALVSRAAARLVREHPHARPGVRPVVAAAVLLDHWAWALAVVGGGALVATGAVLNLAPRFVHLRLEDGEVVGVAVERLSAAAGEPGLRAELTSHLAPLHRLLTGGPRPLLRRSDRLLHGGTGDAVAAALLRQAAALDHVERTRVLALADRLLLDAGTWGEPAWLVVDEAEPEELRTRRRTSCCLWYRLPAQEPCLTCPRLSEDDRRSRLQAQVTA